MLKEMSDALNGRFNALKSLNFGYLLWAHEPVVGADDNYASVGHIPQNLLVPKETPAAEPFLKLAKKIKDFHSTIMQPIPTRGMLVISYCVHCKELIPLFANDDPRCPGCSRFVL